MKKILINICISLFILVFHTECVDGLDRYPLDQPSADTFYTNETEIQGGVNACYSLLNETTDYTNAAYGFDCFTDIQFLRNGTGDENGIRNGSHDFKAGIFANAWGRMYQGIGRCNLLMKKIEEHKSNLSEEKINQFLGELHFLRGYYYLKLITHFGDVQYTDKPIELISMAKLPRTAKSEVLKSIYADFDLAVTYLQNSKVKTFGRATAGTATAYKIRAALYDNDYPLVISESKKLIDSNTYALYPQYATLFSEAGMRDANNKEVIFAIDYNITAKRIHEFLLYAGSRAMGAWSTIVPTQNMVDSYLCTDGLDISQSPLFNKAKPFENRDPRLYYSVVLPGDRWGDNIFETHADSLECYSFKENKRVKNMDCFTNSTYTTFTGYLSRKYSELTYLYTNRISQNQNPFYLYRYAEVLLSFAEAKIESNQIDAECLEAINLIRNGRQDVKMPPIEAGKSQAEMRKIIRRERKIELAFESLRLADLRRWKTAEIVLNKPMFGRPIQGSYSDWPNVSFDENGDPTYDYQSYKPHPSKDYRVIYSFAFNPQRDYLWPIPERELLLNPELGQNPNY